jgi:hypothetical protein
MASALVGGSALAGDRARLPAVAVPVLAVISEESPQLRKGSRQVPAFLQNALWTLRLASGQPSSAFVDEKLRKTSKFLQQAVTF